MISQKIFLAGGTCSGKSTLARRIATHTGYPLTSFGDSLRQYAASTGLPSTREALQQLGQELIDKLGYDGLLQWTIEQSPHIQWNQALVLDGVRHVALYEHLARMFPQNVLVYCVCDKETQLARLMNRDGISREEAEHILSHMLEKLVSTLEPKAHLFFRPGDSTEDFLAQLDAFIAKL